jgi:hypothetical protein
MIKVINQPIISKKKTNREKADTVLNKMKFPRNKMKTVNIRIITHQIQGKEALIKPENMRLQISNKIPKG